MTWPRYLLVIGVIFLGLAFIFPLWKIELEAPQYPEPIGLLIHVNKLRGINEHDLENINILNHYIGMKPIEPESIPELRFMPWILAGLLSLGAVACVFPRRWVITVWIVGITVSGIIGLYDFDQWERDYGSNLNPNAPIKVEGMTYKPPLIGTKQLLNITAHSYPSWGGWSIVAALACAVGGWWCVGKYRCTPQHFIRRSERREALKTTSASVSALLLFYHLGCTPSPEPIRYGMDECAYCKMTIADRRFGAEIVSTKGKVYKFDSIECMVHTLRTMNERHVAHVLVTDFHMPGTLVDARLAWYLRSEQLPSPMGADVSAYADRAAAEQARIRFTGDVLSWQDVLHYLSTLD